MPKGVFGMQYVKMGAAGANGAMGTALAQIPVTAEGTFTLTFDSAEITDVMSEESDLPFISITKEGTKTIEWESMDLSLDNLKVAFGGTIATNTLTAGVSFKIPEQSIEVKTRVNAGTAHTFQFPKATVTATLSGSLTKTDALRIKFTARVLQPYDADGEPVAWMKVVEAA